MNARRVTITVEGFEPMHCVRCDSPAEADRAVELLNGRAITHGTPEPMPALPAVEDEPRRPGRPSFDELIASAIAALGSSLDTCRSTAARARKIVREIAGTASDASVIPRHGTVEAYLRRTRENSPKKSAENSRRARLGRTRRMKCSRPS